MGVIRKLVPAIVAEALSVMSDTCGNSGGPKADRKVLEVGRAHLGRVKAEKLHWQLTCRDEAGSRDKYRKSFLADRALTQSAGKNGRLWPCLQKKFGGNRGDFTVAKGNNHMRDDRNF